MSHLDILKIKQTFNKNWIAVENSYGYRCEEFDSYDWSDCIVFLGCSHVYGMSNTIENTIPYLCSKISGNTSINMGICGGGPETVYHNTFALIEKSYIPKCVVILWPEYTRLLYYKGNEIGSSESPLLVGAWSKKEGNKVWRQHVENAENYMTKTYLIQRSVANAWKLKNVRVLNFTFIPKDSANNNRNVPAEFGCGRDGHSLLSSVYPFTVLPVPIDIAEDNIHLGPKTNLNYAQFITKYY